jgi:hypothetical protein
MPIFTEKITAAEPYGTAAKILHLCKKLLPDYPAAPNL